MPDKRIHRGPHPQDRKLFASQNLPVLRAAAADYSLLLTKGYAQTSALKLVGDKFELDQRQRIAVMRCSCDDDRLKSRMSRQIDIANIREQSLAIDGYNLLITIEAAIAKAPIFIGMDGCFRDICGLHGTYRKVLETIPAAQMAGEFLAEFSLPKINWFFDSPVSNSGRLKATLAELADKRKWNWEIELSTNPDRELIVSDAVAVTSDGIVLDECGKWLNLAAKIIRQKIPDAWLIEI